VPERPSASVDPAEVAKFSAMAAQWWAPTGEAAPLHALNPIRLGYIRDEVEAAFAVPSPVRTQRHPFAGLRMLDVGCGGGLIAEPLARLGGTVTAIDASPDGIAVARAHAAQSGLAIDYRATTAEALLAASEGPFDVVLSLEIVEHVADPSAFLTTCARLVAPGGLMIASTLNRTPKAFALGVVAAERLLRWLPVGTHDWSKFVRPEELAAPLMEQGLKVGPPTGIVLDPLARRWRRSHDASVNYMISGRRPA
jgi:2-polyprenyl-6-hydroxyphenyl methylase/3-demethylubiquinone-9 3-methyltransferase